MKRLLGILIAILMIGSSQASTNPKEYSLNRTTTVIRPQIATPNVQARVKSKRVVKSKVQRAVPYGMDDSGDDTQIEYIATGYRRRDLNKIEHEDGISDKVRWKLFLARQLAMLKYRELHS